MGRAPKATWHPAGWFRRQSDATWRPGENLPDDQFFDNALVEICRLDEVLWRVLRQKRDHEPSMPHSCSTRGRLKKQPTKKGRSSHPGHFSASTFQNDGRELTGRGC